MTYNMYPANWGGDHERQYAAEHQEGIGDPAPVKRYCVQCGFWESEHGTEHPFVANDPVGEVHEEPVDWEARAKAVEDLFADVNWLRLTLTPLHVLRDKVRALLRGEA